MNIKKTFIFILIVLLLLLIAVGVYFFFFQTSGQGTEGGVENGISSFLPFGLFGSNSGEGSQNGFGGEGSTFIDDDEESLETPEVLLQQLVQTPVAGFFIHEDESDTNAVRYVERGTGHIFDVFPSSRKIVRVSNTTIPQIQEVVWADEENLFLRFLSGDGETIETYAARIIAPSQDTSTTTTEAVGSLSGTFMEQNIQNLVVNKSGSLSFHTLETTTGLIGVRSNTSGQNTTTVFDSNVREWLMSWPGETTIVATTKPSADVEGHTFTLNSSTGALEWIFGGIDGLTVVPNLSLTSLLIASELSLGVVNVDTGDVDNLSLSTLPEKCVWSDDDVTIYCAVPDTTPQGDMPDAWYQGLVLFTDDIVKINTENGTVETLFSNGDFGASFDAVDLTLDEEEAFLVFRNKEDLSLWILRFQLETGEETPAEGSVGE